MDRPNLHDIANQIDNMDLVMATYIDGLEKYCDELEEKLAYIKDICETGSWTDDSEYATDILDIISGRYKEWW